MKKAFVMAVAFVLMTACGSKTKQDTSVLRVFINVIGIHNLMSLVSG